MTWKERIQEILPLDERSMAEVRRRLDSIAKPLNGLGLLEERLVRIGGIQRTSRIHLDKKCVVVMCADNGVTAQGVTQTGSDVTRVVTENFALSRTTLCAMAEVAGVRVIPVDMGVNGEITLPGVLNKKIAYGTADISQGPAMTDEQAENAVETGFRIAQELAASGYQIIATGEMGIGNTTTSAALASVLLALPPEMVTGRGAGLSSAALKKKIEVVRRAISVNRPDPEDPIGLLAKLGGFDIGGLMGIYLGGAWVGVPVVIDGVISAVAALLASRLCPLAGGYMLASHRTLEPAGDLLLERLGSKPLLDCGMCVGEGTGAVASLPLYDMALNVYNRMVTFEETSIEEYQPQV